MKIQPIKKSMVLYKEEEIFDRKLHNHELLAVYDEYDEERNSFPDPHDMMKHLKHEKRTALDIGKHILSIGFTLDDRFYYITTGNIMNDRWGRNFDSLVQMAMILPKASYMISNVAADVWELYELTKVEYEAWVGNKWGEADEVGRGMHGFTVRKMQAIINKHPQYSKYMAELSELKNIHTKLKGLIQSINYQQYFVNSLINATRRSNTVGENVVGNSFAASYAADRNSDDVDEAVTDLVTVATMDDEDQINNKKKKRKAK